MTKFLIFLISILLVSCQPQKVPENIQVQVKVQRVVSGQTFQVVGLGQQPSLISEVRLLGIDAPMLRQGSWGNAAKKRLAELIGEKPVKLEFDIQAKDKFGRTLAYVWVDEDLLNEKLVKEGHALFVGRSPNHKYDSRLERAQQWARVMGVGIWNPEKPMRLTPAEFRRTYR